MAVGRMAASASQKASLLRWPSIMAILRTFILQYKLNFSNRTIYKIAVLPKYIEVKTQSESRTRASRFLPGKFQHSTNGTSTFQIEQKLLVCGNISLNPGPIQGKGKPKYPCGECNKHLRKNQDAILCSTCNTWSHAKCLKLTNVAFKYYLQNPNVE